MTANKKPLFTLDELIARANEAATEQTNEEILFLDPDVFFWLNEPQGSIEAYYYYEKESPFPDKPAKATKHVWSTPSFAKYGEIWFPRYKHQQIQAGWSGCPRGSR